MQVAISPVDKSSELYRAVYFREPDKWDLERGATPITGDQYSDISKTLHNKKGNIFAYSQRSQPNSTALYLINGGIIEIGSPTGKQQIRLTHENQEGLEGLIHLFNLPLPNKVPDDI